MTFHVGQKVVCVQASQRDTDLYGIRVGGVYTISGSGYFGRLILWDVAEIKTSEPHAWFGNRFRPVVERKTDISIFTKMLSRKRVSA